MAVAAGHVMVRPPVDAGAWVVTMLDEGLTEGAAASAWVNPAEAADVPAAFVAVAVNT